MNDELHHDEGRRQRALIAALVAPEAQASALPGLLAYRANAHASAVRALGVACPTLRALLGADDFAQLAREFWHAHPPQRGDLGEWGAALPEWIANHAGLSAWPYLADCAWMDLALHRCKRAADAVADAASLMLLQGTDPARLRLRPMPGLALFTSRWPLASIHAAHAAGDEAAFAAVRERMQRGTGESIVVSRDGWRGAVRAIDARGLAFMQAQARGVSLAQALTAAGEGFDFTTWLADALRCHWLQAVLVMDA